MTYQNYEFTAFAEEDFLSGGNTNIGCGDTFTMPGAASVCITVCDNDPYLSGDSRCNENADDHYGQYASIEGDGGELGNGGQIYAEVYFWVHDQDGNWYLMIEIEQEGTNDDYFTFHNAYGGVPPAGSELTVYSKGNIRDCGWQPDYKCLDGGEKVEYGSISGTVFCDTDCDGIDGEVEIIPGCDYTIEAEDMYEYGFRTVSGDQASGGKLVKLDCAWGDGVLCTTFNGKDGTYDVKIRVQDENDGQSKIKLKVNGQLVEAFRLDADTDGGGSDNGGFSTYVIKDVALNTGDDLSLAVWGDGCEFVRIDKIDLEGEDTTTITREPTKEGVTIKLLDADGNVVDTTVTDADGNYSFDQVPVGDYKIMGVAPDGTEFTIKDAGSDDSIDSDVGADGMSDVFTVTADSNTDIDLGVCEKPELGSLSGRYFCDTDNDDQDNNNGDEPGIQGVLVMLLDENGDPTGRTTVTDADGNYSFGDLEAGTYGVKFTDPDGVIGDKVLINSNVGDDASDSDAIGDAGESTISNIVVEAGKDTPDNDAGVEELGSLSGRYFCDTDDDDQDNNNGDEPGIEGVLVMLLDENGNPTGRTTTTNAQGNYSFTGLVAGFYGVKFTDPDGVIGDKALITANVGDDASDSDAIGDAVMSTIQGIEVTPGNDTPDNDAGVEKINEDPNATDDMGKGCADEDIKVDFSDNYSDSDSASVSITMLDGVSIADGETKMISGVEVTLNGDEFIFNGETAYAALDIGEEATQSFTVKVEDSDGGSATANIDVTFCGDANSVESFCESLPDGLISYQVIDGLQGDPLLPQAFDLKITAAGGDARFEGVVFEQAYCLDVADEVAGGTTFDNAPINTADMFCADDAAAASVFDAGQMGVNGLAASENLDLINWIINQDFENDGTGSVDGNFNAWEVQFAVWELTNSFDSDLTFDAVPGLGQVEDTDYIIQQAIANGEGFQAGVGDKIGVIIDPNPATADNAQPFIVAIDFEEYDCLC